MKNVDGMTEYLKAIVNNRMGNTSAAKTALQKAKRLDSALASYAAKDLEARQLEVINIQPNIESHRAR